MCGRYRQGTGIDALLARFKTPKPPFALEPRLEIFPSEAAPVVIGSPERRLELLRWGLVPSWAKDLSGPKPINARAETLSEKPSFRRLLAERRCLVPADGFFEWSAVAGGTKKLRHLVRRSDGLFAMAGLWDRWKAPDGRDLATFTIVTVDACEALKALHPRMPALLAPEDEEAWLAPGTPRERLAELLKPYAGPGLAARADPG